MGRMQPRSAPASRPRMQPDAAPGLELHLDLQSLAMELHCRMRRPQHVFKLLNAAEVQLSALDAVVNRTASSPVERPLAVTFGRDS